MPVSRCVAFALIALASLSDAVLDLQGVVGLGAIGAEQPKQEIPKKIDTPQVVLTERAAKQIRTFQAGMATGTYLRVTVVNGEQFKLDIDEEKDSKNDILCESRGVQVVIDRKSAANVPVGIVIDFLDEGGEKGFKFKSPGADQPQADTTTSLAEARKGFKTSLRPQKEKALKTPVPKPPAELFSIVQYDAAPGKLSAYLSPDPKDGKKRPAIIWITGGDCNSLDSGCWEEGPDGIDQSASAYRKAGLVMMFPALRGGNDNPGGKEGFLGEVDDVLAAAAFLKKQPHVDPNRIYLGGHSTGGTMALLSAEYSDAFRAIISFGPTDDVLMYGLRSNPFLLTDPKELQLRMPIRWLHSIKTPTFVIEGAAGNASSARAMASATKNKQVHFYVVERANHFNVLGPVNTLIAEKLQKDTGAVCNLAFTGDELNKLFTK